VHKRSPVFELGSGYSNSSVSLFAFSSDFLFSRRTLPSSRKRGSPFVQELGVPPIIPERKLNFLPSSLPCKPHNAPSSPSPLVRPQSPLRLRLLLPSPDRRNNRDRVRGHIDLSSAAVCLDCVCEAEKVLSWWEAEGRGDGDEGEGWSWH
jgi:hypothetical protein